LLTQLLIGVHDGDEDGVLWFGDKDKVDEGSGWEQGDWGLFDGILWSKFLSVGQGISCTILITRVVANGVQIVCQLF
jgi:hypothetical protein